jgi:hypothetical protein
MPELTIVPLTAARVADLATLFDQGGDPRWCWCTYYRVRGRSWSNSTPADNRALLGELADRALAPGLVGYGDGGVVGWVSLGPREDYERLAYSKVLAPIDDRPSPAARPTRPALRDRSFAWSCEGVEPSRALARRGRRGA